MLLGIDIGGTKIAAGLVNSGKIAERRLAASPLQTQPHALLSNLLDLCGDWIAKAERVGIACTGLVQRDEVHLANIPGRPKLALKQAVAAYSKTTPVILNDAWAGALGEYAHGSFPRIETLIYVTISTGIGGGIVHQGRLLTSGNGLMAHIGHMSVRGCHVDDIACPCGRMNCVEAIASGSGLARRASALARRPLTSQDVFAAAHHDAQMEGLVEEAAIAVAESLGNLRALTGADCAILGGSLGLRSDLHRRIARVMQPWPSLWKMHITPAKLGADAEIIGAAEAAASGTTHIDHRQCFARTRTEETGDV